MNWQKLFQRIKSAGASNETKIDLDRKLFRRLRPHTLPSWPQFKYIGRFLRPWEKRTLRSLCVTAGLVSIAWLGIFIAHHSGSAPKIGGEYREALIGQPKYLNPIFSPVNDVDADLCALIYSGLFKYDNNQKLIPDLAEKYTASADLKTYEITLRPGIKWSDGEPMTIDDIIFTFEMLQNPEVSSPLLPAFEGVKIEKINDQTVRFTLKEPYAYFLNGLTVGITPAHIWSQIPPAGLKLSKYNIQPVGSGQWKFEKMTKDESGEVQTYTLAPNPNYYGIAPYLTSVEFKFFGNYSEVVNALKGQLAEAASFVPNTLKDKIGERNFIAYKILLPQITALFFNPDKKTELKDAGLRGALSMAISRDKILTEVLSGDAIAADSPLPTFSSAHRAGVKNSYNPEEANKFLDKKWKRIEPEEYFKLRHDEELKNYQAEIDLARALTASSTANSPNDTTESVTTTLERIEKEIAQKVRAEMNAEQTFYRADAKNILRLTITVAENPEYQKTAELIVSFWRAIGVQSSVRVVSNFQIGREIIKERNYDVLIYGEMTGADFDLYPFWHSSQTKYPGLNLAQYIDRDADKLLETARATAQESERIKLLNKFQEIVDNAAPAVFLYTPSYLFMADKDIRGIDLKTLANPSDRYGDLGQWYVKTKWKWKN